MPLSDRDYMRQDPEGYGGGGALRGVTMGLPRPTPVVKWLLIVNFSIYVVQIFFDRETARSHYGAMSTWGGVTGAGFWQVWRYVTFQFLHGGILHVGFNMLGLYMLGTPLEKHFGSRRFMRFYLVCCIVAVVAYVVMGTLSSMDASRPIIGASGGVFGIVLACAILFPSFRLILLFFPLPIRFAALIIFGYMVVVVMQGFASGRAEEAMSDVAHLGGAAAAAVWVWGGPWVGSRRQAMGEGRWAKKLQRQRKEQEEVDAILDQIRESGIGSLSRGQKRTLRQASQRKREEDGG